MRQPSRHTTHSRSSSLIRRLVVPLSVLVLPSSSGSAAAHCAVEDDVAADAMASHTVGAAAGVLGRLGADCKVGERPVLATVALVSPLPATLWVCGAVIAAGCSWWSPIAGTSLTSVADKDRRGLAAATTAVANGEMAR